MPLLFYSKDVNVGFFNYASKWNLLYLCNLYILRHHHIIAESIVKLLNF